MTEKNEVVTMKEQRYRGATYSGSRETKNATKNRERSRRSRAAVGFSVNERKLRK